MKLSRTERLILINQYRILASVGSRDPDGQYCARAIEALQSGYELEYEDFANAVDKDELSEDACNEVVSILQMHRVLLSAYNGRRSVARARLGRIGDQRQRTRPPKATMKQPELVLTKRLHTLRVESVVHAR
jgi:uncharacterized protein YfbU (UPF0304 family)